MKKLLSVFLTLVIVISCTGCSAALKGNTVNTKSAQEFVDMMGMGWNLGNTLDPINGNGDDLKYETSWGNQLTQRELITYIKSQGFDTIRIPVSWGEHTDTAPDYIIREPWFARVQEIVDWCVEEDMFVIINLHHDGEWIRKASVDYDGTMEKYKAIWSQIADRFGDYSNKLIFESMNEIGFDDLGTEKGCELINKMNAEFTELIRKSGKNNKNRYLLLAGYWTDIDRSCEGIVMPYDDKTILSVHYYSPSDFAIAERGTEWGYRETWGTDDDMQYLDGQMKKLKESFIDKGVPVIMGEYGCLKKDKELESRVKYISSVTEYCLKYHICPVFWDNGEEIDRAALSWRTEGLEEAVKAAKQNGLAGRS